MLHLQAVDRDPFAIGNAHDVCILVVAEYRDISFCFDIESVDVSDQNRLAGLIVAGLDEDGIAICTCIYSCLDSFSFSGHADQVCADFVSRLMLMFGFDGDQLVLVGSLGFWLWFAGCKEEAKTCKDE